MLHNNAEERFLRGCIELHLAAARNANVHDYTFTDGVLEYLTAGSIKMEYFNEYDRAVSCFVKANEIIMETIRVNNLNNAMVDLYSLISCDQHKDFPVLKVVNPYYMVNLSENSPETKNEMVSEFMEHLSGIERPTDSKINNFLESHPKDMLIGMNIATMHIATKLVDIIYPDNLDSQIGYLEVLSHFPVNRDFACIFGEEYRLRLIKRQSK